MCSRQMLVIRIGRLTDCTVIYNQQEMGTFHIPGVDLGLSVLEVKEHLYVENEGVSVRLQWKVVV